MPWRRSARSCLNVLTADGINVVLGATSPSCFTLNRNHPYVDYSSGLVTLRSRTSGPFHVNIDKAPIPLRTFHDGRRRRGLSSARTWQQPDVASALSRLNVLTADGSDVQFADGINVLTAYGI